MSRYEAPRSVEIAAPAQACSDALTDYERLPDRQGNVRSCEVLYRVAQGRCRLVMGRALFELHNDPQHLQEA